MDSVQSASDDSDDDENKDDSDDAKQSDFILDLGSLDALLKKDKIKYEKDTIEPGSEAHCIWKMRQYVDKVVRRSNLRSTRTVMIMDRRDKKVGDKTCDLYSFKAQKPFGDVMNDYLYEQIMQHMSGYLVPHPHD
eukprot:338393_1